jgi:hypothetical protein
VGTHWLRFTATELQHDDAAPIPFNLEQNGTVRINHGSEEEMDMAAERLAREMLNRRFSCRNCSRRILQYR